MPARRALDDYRAKRDFKVTAEPFPQELGERSGPLRFMVHKHSARRLHYDLRLELDGALVCWAIPRGPSANPTERRLAVHVEDHPLDYAGFEGVIPKGQYGSGPSLIWDSGTFSPDEGGATYFDDRDAAEHQLRRGVQAGKVSVTLRGRKLKGSWALVHTKPATNEWLLLKHRDAAANAEQDLLDDGASVVSGQTIEELRANAGATYRQPMAIDSPATLADVRPAPLAFVEPMLAAATPLPTRYEGWSFEPKLDGIRAMVSIDHGRVTIRSRAGHDITASYPALSMALAQEPVATCLLDGEIVAIGPDERPSFELLQRRMNLQDPEQIAAADREIPVVYFLFDLLHLDGFDLTGASLADRREMIARVLLPSPRVSQVITIDAPPDQAFEIAVAAGFEGIVAKRNSSRYEPGRRSGSWLKRKDLDRDVFVVGGYTAGTGARAATFGGLLLGQPREDGLAYCGRVGGGFSDRDLDRVALELARLHASASPFATNTPDDRKATWLLPEVRVVVEYAGITSAGVLRLPVFKGFVEAGSPGAVIRPGSPPRHGDPNEQDLTTQLDGRRQRFVLEGNGWTLPLTNLDKVLWPATAERSAVTKRDLLRYAIAVSSLALPHLRDRPLTLLRFPNGIVGKRFYQRHWEQELPPFVETVRIFSDGEGRDRQFLLCNNLQTLLWLCQVADIEWHASLARTRPGPDATQLSSDFSTSLSTLEASVLNYPDFLLFDLDPYIYAGSEATGAEPEPSRSAFATTCEVAFALKETLDSLGLHSFVKTSGATGVHVYVPVLRQFDYPELRAIATTLFSDLAGRRPKDVTMEWVSEKRRGKVFLDANQNARQKSLAVAFSPRAKPGAPVSLTQEWADLGTIYPGDLSILDPWWANRDDPWADILDRKNDLKTLLGL